MKLGEVVDFFEMNRWQRFVFWSINIPRHFLGMPMVIYKFMCGEKLLDDVSRILIHVDK